MVIPSSIWRARAAVLLAAVLWSLNGFFVKVLTKPNPWGLADPPIPGYTLGCFRCLAAALVLCWLVRRREWVWQPLLLPAMLCFASMNLLVMEAMARGGAAQAIWLQYAAPFWVFLVSVAWLRIPARRRDWHALAIAIAGLLLILVLSPADDFVPVTLGWASGVAFAGVLLCLGGLRHVAPAWVTLLNHTAAGLILVPWIVQGPWPTLPQLAVLMMFGAVQMAWPYWLISTALRQLPTHEAALLTLIEPLLSPLWAYLVAGERPLPATMLGGGLIMLALTYRYWPRSQPQPAPATSPTTSP